MMADRCVGIIGAGTMGAGIAQVAATAGWTVELMDVDEPTVRTAIDGVTKMLDRLVAKGRMTDADRAAAAARLLVATTPSCFKNCDLVIEAIVEDLDIKTKVLRGIVPALREDAIIATNTSSLSVSEIGLAIDQPRRTCGMHFFNPAPLMKLCEVIAGAETDAAVVDRIAAIAKSWGKVVARAADVPGFIVNHVARPYYLEAFRILEDGYAPPEVIDDTMKTIGGFRMGPLELTDLIGQDVNTATTRSVWSALDEPPLLTPSALQESLVAAGHLGRKAKRGVYDYQVDPPEPALAVEPRPLTLDAAAREAVEAFATAAVDQPGTPLQNYIFARILAGLIVQAALARERGVATSDDIDIALKYGVNYPRGPFEWAGEIGPERVDALLDALNRVAGRDYFNRPAARA